jgi:Zn-dependent M28 family amino/carboxypeptidase
LKFLATMSAAGTEKLFQNARRSLQSVFDGAALGRPQSFALPGMIRTVVRTEQKSVNSANVIGVLRGSDPLLRDEYVIYTAHLDHEGVRKEVDGDAVFNGAYDNASGIATMLEVARAFKASEPPRRSILFAAVTAEEKGLQGADYFANSPTVPANRIVANVNLDMFLALFPVRDLVAFGAEHSSLGPVVERAARQVGFKLSPDFAPEEVIFIRSDQYPFVKRGVPAVFIVSGIESGDPAVKGADAVLHWTRNVYHSRKDDLSQTFHFPSLVKFAQANFLVGHIVASETAPPSWNKGDFFGDKFRRQDR